MTRWQGFERLAEKIMQDLAPHAEVKRDDRIIGQDSETERQIDVSVRWTHGDDQYLLIIDAKDWSRPADIGGVEKFAGLTKDVRASSGILVCNAGFSRQAHNYAENLGLRLCNVHDAESRDWSRDLTVPIVWIDLTPQVRCHAEIWLDPGDQPQADEIFPFVFSFDDDSVGDELRFPYSKIDVIGSFANLWNAGTLPRELDEEHEVGEERPLRALVRDASGVMRWRPVNHLALHYTVTQSARLGQFKPSQCRGLIDHLDGQAFIASYLPVSEVPILPDESWEPIADPKKVAVSIRGTVVTTEGIQVLDGTGEVRDLSFRLVRAKYPSGTYSVQDGKTIVK